ncbi:MAG: CoA transferase [Pseudomonadota bacterium]
MDCLSPLEIMLTHMPDAANPCVRAASFAAQLAANCGARIYPAADFPMQAGQFTTRNWQPALPRDTLPSAWVQAQKNRIVLVAATLEGFSMLQFTPNLSVLAAVEIRMASWESEATLFAQSGLSDLLGDPNKAPLFPEGHYAAGSIGYAAFAALSGVYAKQSRFGRNDIARVDGVSAMGWINWKAAAAGAMGKDLEREGEQAEWPTLPCIDGYVAFVYQDRDWNNLVSMIDDDALRGPEYETGKLRRKNRDRYIEIVRRWVAGKTKAEMTENFLEYAIPGAAVSVPEDLLADPLLKHRQAFTSTTNATGQACMTPAAPHRVERLVDGLVTATIKDTASALPLAGMKILDLGIITAGAGTSGLLADMGAEVIKVESHTYPDPFRAWGGESDSPLFKFNNRNKYCIAIDLKTAEGKAQFLELAAEADAVVENFRRGVLDRLGLSFDVLRQANPNILLASISGQGATGPGSGHTTYGTTLEAASGFASLTCYENDDRPYLTGRNVNYPDQTVCLYGAAVIALSMVQRKQQGGAMYLDVSQRDVAVYLLGDALEKISAGETGQTSSDFELERICQALDEQWVAIAAPTIAALEKLPGWTGSDAAALQQWVATQTASQLIEQCRANGIGAALVHKGSDMLTHLQQAQSDAFSHSPDGQLVKGFPFQLTHTPMTIRLNSPAVGEHSAEYLGG